MPPVFVPIRFPIECPARIYGVGVCVAVGVEVGVLVCRAVGVAEGLLVAVGTGVCVVMRVCVATEVGAIAAEAAPAVGVAVGDAVGVGRAVEGFPWQFPVPESVNVPPDSCTNFQL